MSEQVFISYRRDGGDVTAKLICEALKNHGYTVFFDYDSISGGYFDARIIKAIENCKDFVLVLPPHSLDRCANDDDWVRQEIRCALTNKKNIIPVILPEFSFPKSMPADIEEVARYNGVHFVMAYFDGVINTLMDRFVSRPERKVMADFTDREPSKGLEFDFDKDLNGYAVKYGKCTDIEVVVPKAYNGRAVVAVADNGFRDCSAITDVVLPASIVRIGKSAFYRCTLLESVNIPDNVTEIGAWGFYQCKGLTMVVIPKKVSSIGMRAFAGCQSVAEYSVDAGNRFYCSAGGSLFTKDMTTLVEYAAGRTEDYYDIPDGVEEIADSSFSECTSLLGVSFPASISIIGKFAFEKCTALTRITVPGTVKTICADAFRDCSALGSVKLSEGIRVIEDSAFYTSGIKSVVIPESVTELGKWAFYECKSLEEVTISAGVKSIGARAFARCNVLNRIVVDDNNQYYCSKDGSLYTKDMKTLIKFSGIGEKSFTVPEGVERIDDSSFSGNAEICSVVFPKTLKSIGAFAFKGCSSIKEVKIPVGVKTIEADAFEDCNGLEKLELPEGLEVIEESAFDDCEKLAALTLPDSVKGLGKWCFYGCKSLKTVTVPKNLNSVGARAFANCTSLKDIKVSFWNKSYRSRGGHLYTKDMKTLVSYAIAVGDGEYQIPAGVTMIEESAFSRSKLFEVIIPETVTVIGDYAFYSNTALKKIRFKGTVEQWKRVSIGKSAMSKCQATFVSCINGEVKL